MNLKIINDIKKIKVLTKKIFFLPYYLFLSIFRKLSKTPLRRGSGGGGVNNTRTGGYIMCEKGWAIKGLVDCNVVWLGSMIYGMGLWASTRCVFGPLLWSG